MNKKVIIVPLNGPPGCGKDTLGDLLTGASSRNSHLVSFKSKLYELTQAIYSVPADKFKFLVTDRIAKDSHEYEYFGGITPRQALIKVSEQMIKPVLGNDYFGKALAATINNKAVEDDTSVFIITDSGFDEELQVLVDIYGPDSILLLRLHREGCDYGNDSRNYIYPTNIKSYDVDNNDSLDELKDNVISIIYSEFKLHESDYN